MPKALGDFLELDAVRSTGGTAVAVLNTGAGLLYPATVPVAVPTLARDGAIPTVS